MHIKFTDGIERKRLAAAVAEILGQPSHYGEEPSCSCRVGDYCITKDGMLTGPDSYDLVTALEEQHGFEPVDEIYDEN